MRSFLIFLTTLTASVTAAKPTVRPELELIGVAFEHGSHELSGAAIEDGQLLIVSDEPTDTAIFATPYPLKLSPPSGHKAARFALKPLIELENLQDFRQSRLDLEGIAICPDTIYLANERAREIFAINRKTQKLSVVPLVFNHQAMAEGGPNAGFEGVACDCQGNILYLAKERDPRRLLAFSLPDGRLLKEGDAAVSDRAGQKVIEPKTGQGLITISPDFADLAFEAGFLYGLERNTHEIVKLDPKTFEPLARVSYFTYEVELYDTGEPYGTAELLVIKNDMILVGFDNNGTPLSSIARQKYGVEGPHGAIFQFKRPQGF